MAHTLIVPTGTDCECIITNKKKQNSLTCILLFVKIAALNVIRWINDELYKNDSFDF